MMVWIVTLCMGAACLICSVFSFFQRGPIFSTMYLVANKHEREKMKTKKNYWFCGFIFAFLGVGFLLLGVSSLFRISMLTYIASILFVAIAISAIILSIRSQCK